MRETNLQLPHPTPFFGRAADIRALDQAYAEGCQLVTLLGAGGIGKTRLALRYSERRLEAAAGGGVWFCDLGGARDASNTLFAVARSLGLQRGAGVTDGEWVEEIGRALACRGQELIVLDNCEQVLETVAGALSRWRQVAPGCLWLATSRERLAIAGERVHEMHPLDTSEAVQIFVHRARMARSDFSATPEELSVIADVVRRLEGVPLAIELAAARMSVLSATALGKRLAHGLDPESLGSGPRDVAPRQRTLEATIAWSWELLEPWERAAMAQCTVFEDGFTAEVAERVIDLSAFAGAPPPLDVVQALRDKSLLRTLSARDGGGVRLGMFDCIRDFALRKRDSPDDDGARERHARFFGAAARHWVDAEADLAPSADTPPWLHDELHNLLAAHGWMLERRLSQPAADTDAMALMLVLDAAVRWQGGFPKLVALLDATIDGPAPPARNARLLGWLLRRRGLLRVRGIDREAGMADLQRALAAAGSCGDDVLHTFVLRSLGEVHALFGAHAEARSAYQQALAATNAPELSWMRPQVRASFADALQQSGELEEALRLHEEALEHNRERGAIHWVSLSRANLGLLLQELGRFDEARAHFEAALHVEHATGMPGAMLRGYLGTLHHEQGDVEGAVALYEQAVADLQAAGERLHEGVFSAYQAAALADLGRVAAAERAFEQARARLELVQATPALEALHVHEGHLDLARGRPQEARRRLEGADGARPDDVRIARRLLRRALEAGHAGAPAASAADCDLAVDEAGRWFRLRGGPTVDLARHHRLRRLLLALVEAHQREPGRPLSTDDLRERVWPKERVLHEAGRHRVYVAMSSLRGMGLGDLLVRDELGYMFQPHARVRVERGRR